jgi:hypothetical protein
MASLRTFCALERALRPRGRLDSRPPGEFQFSKSLLHPAR